MSSLRKIVLINFKRFQRIEIDLDESLTVLIGDNEAGKSSILLALDLVLSGSRSRVENLGLELLLNNKAVADFFSGTMTFATLPTLIVEAYLSEQGDPYWNGRNNSKGILCDGLRLSWEPIVDYSKEITEILSENGQNFPFEYYGITFKTFAGEPYAAFKRPIKHLLLDSSQINSDYANREYTKTVYSASTSPTERHKHENLYRQRKAQFLQNDFRDLNDRLSSCEFAVRTGPKAALESDLLITEDKIPIEQKGKGRQCFVKTEFALQHTTKKEALRTLLLEEPENHLSHVNMRRLIGRILDSHCKQVILATHSSLICSRLDLRKAVLLNSGSTQPATLKQLPEPTAEFFMKAPDNNVLEFVLAKKVILVEGDAEFIMIEAFYKAVVLEGRMEEDGIHVISVDGTSFKRYLDLAKLLQIKTAVIRDNDGDYKKHCAENYSEYLSTHIRVFADLEPRRATFEVCVYEDNRATCDEAFSRGRRTLSPLEYMLANKAEAALELLANHSEKLTPPRYVQEAIEWIRG